MLTEQDTPMPAQTGVPLVEGTHEMEAGVVAGHRVVPHMDVSEGSSEGSQTSPDQESVTVVVPSYLSESTLTADLINPAVKSELEL